MFCCGSVFFFFFQAEDGIRDLTVTGVQTCALPIFLRRPARLPRARHARRAAAGSGAAGARQARPDTRRDGARAMTTHNCETCPAHAHLAQMGLKVDRFDRVVALAGNPNTGKSTLFNALTGLKQHTGNWPGKTVTRAEGGYPFNNVRYKLVDLPGPY